MNIHIFYWYIADTLKASTPLVIGLIATYIAYQQWRTNSRKLKLDLFDRRLKIYKAARRLLNITEIGGATDQITVQTIIQSFKQDVEESVFIFPRNIAVFLQMVLDAALKSVSLTRQMDRAAIAQNEARHEKVSDKFDKTCASLDGMDKTLTKLFTPLLDLTRA